MITIHEFGHYIAGKMLGFKINEFSVGFGKALFQKKKKNGEVFSVRVFPLGGYCAFEGEDEENPSPKAFNNQKPWKRLVVLFMGAFFNFLTAIIFSFILLVSVGYADKVQVKDVSIPPSVVARDWICKNDVVVAVDGVKTDFVSDNYFTTLIAKYNFDDPFVLTVRRDGQEQNLNIKKLLWSELPSVSNATYNKVFTLDGETFNYSVVYNSTAERLQVVRLDKNTIAQTFEIEQNIVTIDEKKYFVEVSQDDVDPSIISSLKISQASIGVTVQNYRYGFFEALGECFVFTVKWAWKILSILWQLITFQLGIKNVGGTVTTIVTMAQATERNLANLLVLVPLISVNLAVFNWLPFPALDGSKMVFVLIEWVRGKPINRNVEGMIHFVGLMILLLFVVLVDVLHFVL